jgi:ribose transport system permease protein
MADSPAVTPPPHGSAARPGDAVPPRSGSDRLSPLRQLLRAQELGLTLVIVALTAILVSLAGTHFDRVSGTVVNNFWNSFTVLQTLTDASFFAVMAIGATVVIISGGIDLSVGSIYALAGVSTAMLLRAAGPMSPTATVLVGLAVCLAVGVVTGLLNGLMVVGLRVHPFIITLGTMWIFRGVAFVVSRAESILVPPSITTAVKASLGLDPRLTPVPMLVMVAMTVVGAVYLTRTVMGRHVFAFGGNPEASRYSGLRLGRIQTGVYVISGLTTGVAAFLGVSYYGSASSGDANGYELYVIAAAVVGGASLIGGKGSALGATLGAFLIVLIRQSIRTLHFDQNYEWIVIGAAIIVAVVLDRWSSRLAAKRLARGR